MYKTYALSTLDQLSNLQCKYLKKRSNYVGNNVFIQGYTEPQNSDEESQNKVENWLPEDMKVS